MLRRLFNLWVEEAGRMGTLDEYVEHEAARQSREARMKAKAEMMLARQRAREGV